MKKLNIAIAVSDLEFGGAQRQVVELANNINREEFNLYICSLSDYVPLSEFLNEPNRLKIIKRNKRFDFSVIVRLVSFLKEKKVDLIHSFLFDATIASRIAGKIAGSLVVGSERNTNYSFKKIELLAYFLTKNLTDCIIANSWSGAKFNSKMLRYPLEMYRVVYNGVNIQRFKPLDNRTQKEIKRKFGIAENRKIIGMFASFKPQKNHEFFIRAAYKIKQRYKNIVFLFVGDVLYKGMSNSYETRDKIIKLINEFDLQKETIFLGNQKNVEELYPICDLTVLPSLYEGTPNVALESMACGVPLVATNVSDNERIIPDGKVGFIVPLNDMEKFTDRVCKILENDLLRQKLSKNARQWIERQFSSQKMAENMGQVYKDLLLKKNCK